MPTLSSGISRVSATSGTVGCSSVPMMFTSVSAEGGDIWGKQARKTGCHGRDNVVVLRVEDYNGDPPIMTPSFRVLQSSVKSMGTEWKSAESPWVPVRSCLSNWIYFEHICLRG